MTAITREYLDALLDADSYLTDGLNGIERDLIAALRRVLDLRDDAKGARTSTTGAWINVHDLDAALAGTQTDDGAGVQISNAGPAPSSPAYVIALDVETGDLSTRPAPSSPDRIGVVKQVREVHYDNTDPDRQTFWSCACGARFDRPPWGNDEQERHENEAIVAALDAYDREHLTGRGDSFQSFGFDR